MLSQGSAPSLYSVEDVYREPYAARLSAFMQAGLSASLRPAREDAETLALALVDYQHDFVAPTGALAVPGAQDDVARLLAWLYRNAGRVTRIYLSLDTHLPIHIFYSAWWVNPATGEHPQPFTTITAEEVERGVWSPTMQPEWSRAYLRLLARQAKKDLMIWPPHTMEGTLGHMLTPALSEAVAWHSIARQTQPIYVSKGRTARTEFYGIFGAEVPDPDDAASGLNMALLDEVMSHDHIYLAGEARSHCVLETARQLVAHCSDDSDALRRLHLLRDCTSAVAHPTINFDALADTEFAEMQRQGMRLISSADPLE